MNVTYRFVRFVSTGITLGVMDRGDDVFVLTDPEVTSYDY